MDTFSFRVDLYFNHQLVGSGHLDIEAYKEPSSLEIALTALEASGLPEVFQDCVLYHPTAWSAHVVPLTGPSQGVVSVVSSVVLQA